MNDGHMDGARGDCKRNRLLAVCATPHTIDPTTTRTTKATERDEQYHVSRMHAANTSGKKKFNNHFNNNAPWNKHTTVAYLGTTFTECSKR